MSYPHVGFVTRGVQILFFCYKIRVLSKYFSDEFIIFNYLSLFRVIRITF